MLDKDTIKSIENLLEKDLDKEMDLIKNELFYFLDKDLDMFFLKEFIKHYPVKLLRERSEVLLDTVLNYLMKEVLESIRKQTSDIQYAFARENLREKVKNWALTKENRYNPDILRLKEEETFVEKTITVAPGVAVSAGGLIAVASVPETLILKAIPAVSTLAGPIYIFKKIKEKNRRLKNIWKKEINNYLEKSKKEIKVWLKKVIEKFEKELGEFYQKNKIEA
ncbi:hypothetical protein F1847_05760 [Thermodesulfobacterium sp. TA1]|uniref:hypothetical protein n=1 Tax=Thermodesulfobacterium sp. TA1 TaxID=2234087 RepID=UPI0012322C27|nr:hypothetical protein [Thermodesulfobacterium sp. TA1]QER42269.1 hypothetical protein F1847_05760 [Thermodesulfobacterium sp. TA1]